MRSYAAASSLRTHDGMSTNIGTSRATASRPMTSRTTDYETEDAKEWRQTFTQPKKRRILAPMDYEPDNDARASWRRFEEPVAHYTLPRDFAPPEQRRETANRGKKLHAATAPVFPELQQIADKTQTTITPAMFQSPDGLHIKIWGTRLAADDAIRQIKSWVESYRSNENVKQKSWAKIPSITPEQRARHDARIEEEMKKEEFRRKPTEDVYPATALLEWPVEHGSPDQVAGRNLEAYDPIRTELLCYIVQDPQQHALTVMGYHPLNVRQALKRIRTSLFQTVAVRRPSRIIYLITPLTGPGLHSTISLIPYRTSQDKNRVKHAGPPRATPQLSGPLLGGKQRQKREDEADEYRLKNMKNLDRGLVQTLDTLRHYRGSVHMRANLGVFALTTYRRRDEMPLEDFEMMMQDDQVKGCVVEDISLTSEMLKHTSKAHNLLAPGQTYDNSANIKPSYSAKAICSAGTNVYCLTKTYEEQGNGELACSSKSWTRLGHLDIEPYGGLTEWLNDPTNKLFDANLIDMAASDAWNLEISVAEPVNESKMPMLTDFANELHVKLPTTTSPHQEINGPFVDYQPRAGLIVQAVEQRQSWMYNVKNSPFVCEVAKIQEFTLVDFRSGRPNQSMNMLLPGSPRWLVSVFSPEWDVAFADNASLATGESAKWDLDVPKLVPGGLEGFVTALDNVRQVVRGEWQCENGQSGANPSVRNALSPLTHSVLRNGRTSSGPAETGEALI